MEVWKFSLLRFIKFKTWLCLLTIAAKLCSVITPVCSLKIEGNAGFEALSAAIDKAIKPLTALRMPKKFLTFPFYQNAEKPRRSRRGWIGIGRAGLNAQEPNNTHAVPEPSMGEGAA